MDACFLPSPSRAAGLRASMAAGLLSSLHAQLSPLDPDLDPLPTPPESVLGCPGVVRPLDFAAYFDLLIVSLDAGSSPLPLPLNRDEVVQRARRAWDRLVTSLHNPLPPTASLAPTLSTLSSAFYDAAEVASWVRWWDMEPHNALQLRAVSPEAFDAAETHVRVALNQLRQVSPDLHGELLAIVSDIVLAEPGPDHRMAFGGISSFSSWGAICLNVACHTHWVHYYKKMVHECAHLLLFALAQDEPLLLNDPTETYTSPLREDPRPLDGIYHAAFVSAREAYAIDAYLLHVEAHPAFVVDPQDVALMQAQLEVSVLAFWDCCAQLADHAQLTPLGQQILDEAKQYMDVAFRVTVLQ